MTNEYYQYHDEELDDEQSQAQEVLAQLYGQYQDAVTKHQREKLGKMSSGLVREVVEALEPIAASEPFEVQLKPTPARPDAVFVSKTYLNNFETPSGKDKPLYMAFKDFKAVVGEKFADEGRLKLFIEGLKKSEAELLNQLVKAPFYRDALRLIASTITEPYCVRYLNKPKRGSTRPEISEENLLSKTEKDVFETLIIEYLTANPKSFAKILARLAEVKHTGAVLLGNLLTPGELQEIASGAERVFLQNVEEDKKTPKVISLFSRLGGFLVGKGTQEKPAVSLYQKVRDSQVGVDQVLAEVVDISTIDRPGKHIIYNLLSQDEDKNLDWNDYFWDQAVAAARLRTALDASMTIQVELQRRADDPALDNAEILKELIRTKVTILSVLARLRETIADILAEEGVIDEDSDKAFGSFEEGFVEAFDEQAMRLVEAITSSDKNFAVDRVSKVISSYLIDNLKTKPFMLGIIPSINNQTAKNRISAEVLSAIQTFEEMLQLPELVEAVMRPEAQKPKRKSVGASTYQQALTLLQKPADGDFKWLAQLIEDGELPDEMVDRLHRLGLSDEGNSVSMDEVVNKKPKNRG